MSRFVKLTSASAGARPVFVNAAHIVCIGTHEGLTGVSFVNSDVLELVRETPAEILALLDAAPADEVTDEAVDAACTAYRLATSGRDVAWRDDMRAAIEAALRVMRGQR